MGDAADRAQAAEEMFLRAALNRGRRQESSGVSAITCVDCGALIPERRRKLVPGCRSCVGCQADREELARLGQEDPR